MGIDGSAEGTPQPLRRGAPWGTRARGPVDLEVRGGDHDLAAAVAARPRALVRFRPDQASDVARAVGLRASAAPGATEVPMDALALTCDPPAPAPLAVNVVVLGTPPDRLGIRHGASALRIVADGAEWFAGRATTVVAATGQFLRGHDLVPRGHPGDGRAEAQVYRLAVRERRPMRRRLPGGGHVPHPRILQRGFRHLEADLEEPASLEVDGVRLGPVARLVIEVVPGAYRLLV